jgi:hypothetical protein
MRHILEHAGIIAILVAATLSGAAVAQNSQVYVSFVTGLTSGGTNVYQISSSGALLTTTLNIGGGGPVAVDAQQNVYVIEANLDGNLYQLNAAVYQFANGSTQGNLLFTANNFGAEVMTVGSDGTIYMAGQVPEGPNFEVLKFAPPNYTQQVLWNATNPLFPTGISVDAAGNLFVGYLDSFRSVPVDTCNTGCVFELQAGQSKWQTRLPDLAANSMAAGPFATTDGSLIFWTSAPGRFNYLETVKSGSNYPSKVLQLSPNLFGAGNITLAYGAGGTELWATGFGFNGFLGTNVYGIDYPSGTTALTFPVTSPADLVFITGIGVSPAYFP